MAAEEYQQKHPQWKYLQFDVLAITIINGKPAEYFLIEDVYFQLIGDGSWVIVFNLKQKLCHLDLKN